MTSNRESRMRSGTLFASVLLNLFLVGVIAGVIPHHAHHHMLGGSPLTSPYTENMVNKMTQRLNDGDAKAFKDVIATQNEALNNAHELVKQAMKEVADAYQQEPIDPAALQGALDKLDAAKSDLDGIVKKIVQDSAEKLSPEGRKSLATITH